MLRSQVAAVVIGRNEGERLRACLASLLRDIDVVVYVDSGSTDGSLWMAAQLGAQTVALNTAQPFTAARARNAGFAELRRHAPEAEFVQFVDGDCEVLAGWLAQGAHFLARQAQVAAVCGRRSERHPERSVYNRLCDLEWAVPAGPALSCGGDVMMRSQALRAVGGYRDSLIAGEEPELCVRLRRAGWQVHVLDTRMTLHDAAMTRFSQWWLRTVRAGHAYAEGAALHGAPPERHAVRELRRALLWGAVLPLCAVAGAAAWGPAAWALLCLYPLQFGRLAWRASGRAGQRVARAAFLVIGKFAEAQGAARYGWHRLRRRTGGLIEYK